ncbi:hypothetical protein AN189_07270 [Loktanella sp. 3ANDIMAR09]|nr:hypothetical protein AN189_07270 [Loktanella sp. 3ANDIMAR09]
MLSEEIAFYPLTGNTPDAARQKTTLRAVVRIGTGDNSSVTGGTSRGWGTRLSAGKGQAHVRRSGQVIPDFRKHDKVRLVDRVGQPFFEILTVHDGPSERIVLELGAT